MRRALRYWPALAVVAAAVLAALAHGVLAAADDARTGTAPGALARAGEALVGTAPDRRLRRALSLSRAAAQQGLSPGAAFRRRAKAEAALAAAVAIGPARERARAAHELAVLELQDSAVDQANASRYVQDALASLRRAIRLDPRDATSKFDLELLLTLQPKQQHEGRSRSSHGAAGAGESRSGDGY